jgi:hypothetical protein
MRTGISLVHKRPMCHVVMAYVDQDIFQATVAARLSLDNGILQDFTSPSRRGSARDGQHANWNSCDNIIAPC